jgi:hypothetical protein
MPTGPKGVSQASAAGTAAPHRGTKWAGPISTSRSIPAAPALSNEYPDAAIGPE